MVYCTQQKVKKEGTFMSIGGMNNWNNNDQARMQVENSSLENKMWETDPDKARESAKPRLLLHLVVLVIAVIGLTLLVRGL